MCFTEPLWKSMHAPVKENRQPSREDLRSNANDAEVQFTKGGDLEYPVMTRL